MEIVTLRREAGRWTVSTGAILDLVEAKSGAMFIARKDNQEPKPNAPSLSVSVEMMLQPTVRILSETRGNMHSFTRHRLVVGRASFLHDCQLNRNVMVPESTATADIQRKAIWLPDADWTIERFGLIGFESAARQLTQDLYIVEAGQELNLRERDRRKDNKCTMTWDGQSFAISDGWVREFSTACQTIGEERYLLDEFKYVGPDRPAGAA